MFSERSSELAVNAQYREISNRMDKSCSSGERNEVRIELLNQDMFLHKWPKTVSKIWDRPTIPPKALYWIQASGNIRCSQEESAWPLISACDTWTGTCCSDFSGITSSWSSVQNLVESKVMTCHNYAPLVRSSPFEFCTSPHRSQSTLLPHLAALHSTPRTRTLLPRNRSRASLVALHPPSRPARRRQPSSPPPGRTPNGPPRGIRRRRLP